MNFVQPIFRGQKLEWEVNLPPEKVHQHLRQIALESQWWADPLLGDFRADGFVVRRAPGIHRNAKLLEGRISATAQGSRISANFRLSRLAFLVIFGFMALLCFVPVLALNVALSRQTPEDFGFAVFSLLFPVLGLFILHNLGRLYRGHEQIIADLLDRKFKPFQKKSGEWYPIR